MSDDEDSPNRNQDPTSVQKQQMMLDIFGELSSDEDAPIEPVKSKQKQPQV
jgi:hypothetical protein